MKPSLRILYAGLGSTIQDKGRTGYLRHGITPAGPMDWTAFRTANLALGNEANAAAIEISVAGLEVICEGAPLRVAFAGGAFAWRRDETPLPSAACILLRPGERLAAHAGPSGAWAYLALEGGVDVPAVLGSRATHLRSAMGGLEGRMLREADVLRATASTEASSDMVIDAPWLGPSPKPVRVLLGPQDDHFRAEGLATFFRESYRLSAASDRMAYRFDGPEIAHAGGFDIVSDGVALGAIQVAGDRKPMILMADRQPTGGYPKLGHVARADLGRLAQLRPGETCRFEPVSLKKARAALLRLEDEIAQTTAGLQTSRREPTGEALLAINLITGVTDALCAES